MPTMVCEAKKSGAELHLDCLSSRFGGLRRGDSDLHRSLLQQEGQEFLLFPARKAGYAGLKRAGAIWADREKHCKKQQSEVC